MTTNTAIIETEVRSTDADETQRCECKRHPMCHRKRRPKRRFCSACIEYCGAK